MVSITAGEHKGKFFRTKNILIATGCKMRRIPDLAYDGAGHDLAGGPGEYASCRSRSIIVGAGAIGVEFAYFYNAFGTKVTLVEMLPHVLPVEDEEWPRRCSVRLEKQGITVHREHEVRELPGGQGVLGQG
jgi:dihydrolipoamide dehydrogenase